MGDRAADGAAGRNQRISYRSAWEVGVLPELEGPEEL